MIKPMKIKGFMAVLLLLPCGAAWAEPDGAALAAACISCHGDEGRGGGTIPALAGRDMAALQTLMLTMREAQPGATIMARLMRGYDEDEIAALARYFAGMTP